MANYQLEQTGAEVQALLNAVESPDTTPAAGSSNLITSGAVQAAVAGVSAEVTALGHEVVRIPSLSTINGAQSFAKTTGWSAYNVYAMKQGVPYRLTNLGDSSISVFQCRTSTQASVSVSGFSTITKGQSCIITPNGDVYDFRYYSSPAAGLLLVECAIDMLTKAMQVGVGFTLVGGAVPTGTPLSTDAHISYIAGIVGTYTNFGGLIVADNEVALLKWDGTSWSKSSLDLSSAASVDSISHRKRMNISGWTSLNYPFASGVRYRITNTSGNQITTWEAKSVDNGTITINGMQALSAGQSCDIYFGGRTPGVVRFYASGNPGANIIIEPDGAVVFDNLFEGYLEKDTTKKILIVSKDGADGHYATISAAIAAVNTNSDSAFDNQYEIIVYPGIYNENNLIIPAFTHIHGMIPGSVVVTSEGITGTLPVFDFRAIASKLSNLQIYSYTGYCFHYDASMDGQGVFAENLVCRKCSSGSIIGGGTACNGVRYIFKNCSFVQVYSAVGTVSCHTKQNQNEGNVRLLFEGCTFAGCNPQLGSVGGFGNYVCEFKNCSFYQRGLYNWYSDERTIDKPETYLFNRNEWQIVGGGNKGFNIAQTAIGKTIRLTADYPITISGTAADVIFGKNPNINNTKTTRIPCYIISQLYIEDAKAGGSADVFQLWKRLGDCSGTNKTLSVAVNGVTKTYTFTADYLTDKTAQATIIAAMQAALTNVTIEAYNAPARYSFENVNTSETMRVKVTAADILYGEFVTKSGAKATSATPARDILGMAVEDAPIGGFVKVWSGPFVFYTGALLPAGDYGLDANGALDSSAAVKIGYSDGVRFYPYTL